MGKKWNAENIRKTRKPNIAKVDILLDPEIDLELQRLEDELVRAQSQRSTSLDAKPAAVALVEQIEALGKQAEEATVTFEFHGIGRRAWLDLIKEHPPTGEQRKDNPKAQWNADTFPIAALTASCAVPEGLTEEWWTQTLDEWDEGDVSNLWKGCLQANLGEVGEGKAALRLASEVRANFGNQSQPQSE